MMQVKHVVKRTSYFEAACTVCKKKFTGKTANAAKEQALRCSEKPVEKKIFSIGDKVRNIEQRTCGSYNKPYYFRGRITKVLGPMLSDYDYECRWLGGKSKRLHGHVYQFEVTFTCPYCGEERTELYYAPMLKRAKQQPQKAVSKS